VVHFALGTERITETLHDVVIVFFVSSLFKQSQESEFFPFITYYFTFICMFLELKNFIL